MTLEVDLSDYKDYTDALQQLGRLPWPVSQDRLDEVYEYKRIHSSLGYLTPAEFEDRWRFEQALVQDVH